MHPFVVEQRNNQMRSTVRTPSIDKDVHNKDYPPYLVASDAHTAI
jgi:hypothetical protein